VVESSSEGGCHQVIAVYSQTAVRDAIGDAATCLENRDAASVQAASLKSGLAAVP